MSQKPESGRKYAHISHKLRLELIDLIEKEKYPLSVASDLLGIKLSTAKLIMSKFKSRGYVTKYKTEKTQRKDEEKSQEPQHQKKHNASTSHQLPVQPLQPECKVESQERQFQQEVVEGANSQQMISMQSPPMGMLPQNGWVFPIVYLWSFPQ